MSIKQPLTRLEDLTNAVANATASAPSIGKGKRGSGRYGRRPNFGVISAPSTRPNSGAGVTFHFKHSFVSKKNSISEGYRDQTSAPAHQRYIERAGAAEKTFDGSGETREISFGNLGSTKEERADFWRKVERTESKAGRVQCRMIAELPHELSAEGREKAAKAFMAQLGKRGFPHWAVIHAPDKHNDKRNYHLHAVYYDRPCSRLENGKWDFEVETQVTWKNRQKVIKRPLKQPKDAEARGKEWIRGLRRSWAEEANKLLAEEGLAKRYDPRPYRESGIRKMPTAHLGNKIALAESQGIDTLIGAENSRREMRFRLSKPDAVFDRISASLDKAISGIRLGAQGPQAKGDPRQAMMATLACRQILSAGLKAAKAREANKLAVDVIGARLAKRAGFLDAEYDRLTLATPKWLGEDDAFKIAASLWDERRLIDDATADIAPFRAGCRQAMATHETETKRLDAERQGAVAAMLKAYPALKQMLKPEELSALALPLADVEESALPIAGFSQTQDNVKAARTPGATAETAGAATATQGTQAAAKAAEQAKVETAVRTDTEERAEARDTKSDAKPESKSDANVGAKDEAGLVTKDTNQTPGQSAAEAIREIPGALQIADEAARREIEKTLVALPGWQLRYHFLATRDASDFAEDEALAKRHDDARQVIEKEAAKRGLDLETGRMDPAKAKDQKSFERHQGEWEPYPEDPVLVRELA